MAILRVWGAEVLTCGLWTGRVGDGHVCRVGPRPQLLFFTQTQGIMVETTAAALATVGAEDSPFFSPSWKPKRPKRPKRPKNPGQPAAQDQACCLACLLGLWRECSLLYGWLLAKDSQ